MDNSTTGNYTDTLTEAYWSAVYAESLYQASKTIGKYVTISIFLLGTLGNLLSFAVMVRKQMRRSSTAFYMASLALADTAVLVLGCLRRWVIEVFELEPLNAGPAACHAVNFLQYCSFDMAVWILVAMTLDRVIVVTSPLKAQIYATRCRAAIALLTVLTVCAGINCHFFFTVTYKDGICMPRTEYEQFYRSLWTWVDATVYSFLPFVFLLILNVIILIFLSRADAKKQSMSNPYGRRAEQSQTSAMSRKLTIMLLSVTFAFIVLTAPTVVLDILREKGEPFFDLNKPNHMARYILTRQISRILLYLNHSVNFLLYCITGSKFREELAAMFKCQSVRERNRKRTVSLATGSMMPLSSPSTTTVVEQSPSVNDSRTGVAASEIQR